MPSSPADPFGRFTSHLSLDQCILIKVRFDTVWPWQWRKNKWKIGLQLFHSYWTSELTIYHWYQLLDSILWDSSDTNNLDQINNQRLQVLDKSVVSLQQHCPGISFCRAMVSKNNHPWSQVSSWTDVPNSGPRNDRFYWLNPLQLTEKDSFISAMHAAMHGPGGEGWRSGMVSRFSSWFLGAALTNSWIRCNSLDCCNSLGPTWRYPLVNIQKAMENHHRNSGFSHEKWWIFP